MCDRLSAEQWMCTPRSGCVVVHICSIALYNSIQDCFSDSSSDSFALYNNIQDCFSDSYSDSFFAAGTLILIPIYFVPFYFVAKTL
jgi:hypothetical protein